MNNAHLKLIRNQMEVLVGKEMQYITRAGSMGDLGFGKLVEKNVRRFDENKKIIMKKVQIPQYILHIDCHFRMSCGNIILLSRGDIFQPPYSLENEESFDYQTFHWDQRGGNRFDEIVEEIMRNKGSDFIVKKISVNQFGDLKCSFSNGFLLQICPDISGNEECWRFFEQNSDDHLIVSGQGIEM